MEHLTDEQFKHLSECDKCSDRMEELEREESGRVSRGLIHLAANRPRDEGPAASPPRELGPDDRIGQYRLTDKLGEGATGTVFKADDEKLGRIVAIKVLKPQLGDDPAIGELLGHEAQMAAQAGGDYIVRVHAFRQIEAEDCTDGRPHSVLDMEYVEGESLSQRFEREGPLLPREAAQIGRDVALGLKMIHGKGVINNDVKPSNVLLEGVSRRAKLTDFGVASQVRPGQCGEADSVVLGWTYEYLSPERFDDPVCRDVRSDIFSLGAVLYQALTGKLPFGRRGGGDPRSEIEQFRRRVQQDEPAPPCRSARGVPADLSAICMKCLAKKPDNRYASAAELADDLQRFLEGHPVKANPVGRVVRVLKCVRRYPWMAALIAALFLVTATGFGLVTWQWCRADDRADAAEAAQQNAERSGQAEAAALRRAADKARAEAAALREKGRLSALANLERGLTLCWRGDSNRGMLWLALAAKTAPSDAQNLQYAIRANINGWLPSLTSPPPVLHRLDNVVGAGFSRDGQRVMTANWYGGYRVWDVLTGAPAGPTIGIPVLPAAVASNLDLTLLGMVSSNGTVRIWDTKTGKPIAPDVRLPEWYSQPASKPDLKAFVGDSPRWNVSGPGYVEFSADLKFLVVSGADGVARFWRVPSGERAGATAAHGELLRVQFSPDGRLVMTADKRGTVRLWKVPTGEQVGAPMNQPDITGVHFSRDGTRLVTFGLGGTHHLWSVPGGNRVGGSIDHPDTVWVAFSPDGRRMVTAGLDGTARLWDLATGKAAGVLEHPYSAPPTHVHAANFSSDSRMLVTASCNGMAQLWDVDTGKRKGPPLTHQGQIHGADFSRDGETLMTTSPNGCLYFWDVATGRRVLKEPRPPQGLVGELSHKAPVVAVAFSPDGSLVATAGTDGSARVWRTPKPGAASENEPVRTVSHPPQVYAVTFSPNGKEVWTAGLDGVARRCDVATGRPVGTPLTNKGPDGLPVPLSVVALGRDGKTALTCGIDGYVRFWDVATGQALPYKFRHQDIIAACLSPDGRIAVTGGADCVARLWRAPTGELLATLRLQASVISLAVSADSGTVMAGCLDGSVRLWDVTTGQEKGVFQHKSPAETVAFSPDGKTILVGGGAMERSGAINGWATVWDVNTIQPLGPPLTHFGPVKSVAFSPDGKRVLTGSFDGTARLWELPSPAEGSAEEIERRIQDLTGKELSDDGSVRTPGAGARAPGGGR